MKKGKDGRHRNIEGGEAKSFRTAEKRRKKKNGAT